MSLAGHRGRRRAGRGSSGGTGRRDALGRWRPRGAGHGRDRGRRRRRRGRRRRCGRCGRPGWRRWRGSRRGGERRYRGRGGGNLGGLGTGRRRGRPAGDEPAFGRRSLRAGTGRGNWGCGDRGGQRRRWYGRSLRAWCGRGACRRRHARRRSLDGRSERLGGCAAADLGGRWRLVRGGFLRLDLTAETVAVGAPADAVRLGILDARRMALHPDAHVDAQVEGLFVGQAKLTTQFVNPDLLCQVLPNPLYRSALDGRSGQTDPSILARSATCARSMATAAALTATRRALEKAC